MALDLAAIVVEHEIAVIVVGEPGPQAPGAAQDAAAAQASAESAAVSAETAATQAGIAATKAGEAADSADTAATAAGVAAAQAAQAADSADAAAADQATVAADKAMVAADKAIIAADKATVAADKGTVAADKAIVQAIAVNLSAVDGHTSGNLSAANVTGTIIDNVGQVAACDLALPAAAAGMNFLMICGEANAYAWRIRSAATDKFYLNGVAGADNGYVGIAAPTIGAYISGFAFKTSGGTYDWMIVVGFGSWGVI